MEFRFNGTGDSAQVPRFGCDCRACTRARVFTSHQRGPCCAELSVDGRRYLLDAGRMDLAHSCELERPAAFFVTHYHADHVQGLFHLRWGTGTSIPVYGPKDPSGCADLYRNSGILDFQPGLKPFKPLDFDGLTVTPVPLNHSKPTLGYCLDDGGTRLAYLTDTQGLPGATERFLRQWDADVVVLDACHPASQLETRNHNSITQALEIITRLDPPRAYLTHISHELDAERLDQPTPLPPKVRIARDGETLEDWDRLDAVC
ncbi:phosphonate metabolism protein PhnP [Halomonas litopenaei]|uniref:Phosphonate metabolism protein PhnP n=1 Tax=Halomonas litopenaei TaxID=2109328 RepID=A0ABX5IS14_9GAMM|nr:MULTISPECIES: phosphonate metabolism protein PhnP [Halomonas]MBS8270321.1 phosphonate metabolism protein PhnP [Halomonas litopenaei]PTL89747.1 phosphonate metabolism protein PhnP [Halomonas sp. SYSU XM8]PTL91931.1 phosphonate metabolism protein PhnP [Halomonas litopenaei]